MSLSDEIKKGLKNVRYVDGELQFKYCGYLEAKNAPSVLQQAVFMLPEQDVQSYLANGEDATVTDLEGNTLAHAYPLMAKELMEYGCDIDWLNDKGYSALMTAVLDDVPLWDLSRTGTLGDLVEATSKETLNRVYPNGETILTAYLAKAEMILDEHEDGEILPVLLRQGADVNQQNAKGQTPLDVCKASNKADVVAMMIPYGVNLDSKKENGKTLLIDALEQKDEKLAKVLLKNGADIKIADKDGNTPLHYAARASMTEMVAVLVKAGAQPWVPNKAGELPHHFAKGIAHEYLKMHALSCASDYKFHSGFVYNPAPQKIASQPVAGQTPDNQNSK